MMKTKSIVSMLAIALSVSLNAPAFAGEKNIVDTALSSPAFSTLVAALKAAELVDTIKGNTFTVFAPTNEAFEKLPDGTLEELLKPENKAQLGNILKSHVVPGSGHSLSELLERKDWGTATDQNVSIRFEDGRIRVNDATLQASDIACENGVIHVIDSVLLPSTFAHQTIVSTADAAGRFTTLLAAAKAAGLAEGLTGEGPFTVFAPTDDAFAKIPKATLSDLLKPANKQQLADLLKYHVVAGAVSAGDALKAGTATTLNGSSIQISYKDGGLRVQWAKILEVDVDAGNGLIHIIDSVMLPPGFKLVNTTKTHVDTIVQAIDQGVPLYNRGREDRCVAIYMAASKTLLQDEALPKYAQDSLQHAVSRANHSSCDKSQAWILRHGLDRAYAVLKSEMREELAQRSN
jgi:transforming growth factor-beta-induced protein